MQANSASSAFDFRLILFLFLFGGAILPLLANARKRRTFMRPLSLSISSWAHQLINLVANH